MEKARSPKASQHFFLLASGARADHFDFHAAILRAAFGGLVVGDRLLLALAFRVDTVGFQALGRQVCLRGGLRVLLRPDDLGAIPLRALMAGLCRVTWVRI